MFRIAILMASIAILLVAGPAQAMGVHGFNAGSDHPPGGEPVTLTADLTGTAVSRSGCTRRRAIGSPSIRPRRPVAAVTG